MGRWTSGSKPHGYEVDGRTHQLVVKESEAPLVSLIFDHYVKKNQGTHAIARMLIERGHWFSVRLDGDDREYGGLLLQSRGKSPKRVIAVLIHGIAGDVGQSAYFVSIARRLIAQGASVLFMRVDGFIDHAQPKHIVRQGDSNAFTQIIDRTLEAAAEFDDAYQNVSVLLIPHSLAIAKTIRYGNDPSALNHHRVRGVIALSPVDVRRGFSRPSFVPAAAQLITRCGFGSAVVPASVLRRFGGSDIDWGITVSSIAALGAFHGPFDIVHTSDTHWVDTLDSRFPLAPDARHVVIGEYDQRHGRDLNERRKRIGALVRLIAKQTTWRIYVVPKASHSFQQPDVSRQHESQLLF